jgi:hypothetical protein
MLHKDREIPVRMLDADGLADNSADALVVLMITRREIESGHIASAIERLHVLTDSRENVIRYRESLAFMVDGYNDDPRELAQIPEVSAFFRTLNQAWPHWLWFLMRGGGMFSILFSLLCDGEPVSNANGAGVTYLTPHGQIQKVFTDMMERGLSLFGTYKIEIPEVEAAFDSALKELGL